MRDENQLHAAVVELVALDDAEIKYSTVQNWYPGLSEGKGGIYELGGPDVRSFRELMEAMLKVIERRRPILPIPVPLGHVMGFGFELLNKVTLGLVEPQVTRDQVKNLAVDNVASGSFPGLSDLGITPTALEAVLPEYLWRFRPSGQYAEIKNSAKKLKGRDL